VALSPTNVWSVGGSATGEPLDTIKPAAEHWDGTSWSLVSVPNPDQGTRFRDFLTGVAAISANDIWAVGITHSGTLTEHWDGTSWSIIKSPDPGRVTNSLSGVTALSDGTVAAVGAESTSTTTTGLILQNAASAPPKKTSTAAAVSAPFTMTGIASGPLAAPATTAGATAAVQNPTMPVVLHDAPPVDPLFASAGKPLQFLSFIGHSSAVHKTAAIWDLDFLPEDIGLLD
jgi:hypothetical protein